MSWFNVDLNQMTGANLQANLQGSFSEMSHSLADTVQAATAALDSRQDMLEKLTLTTAELSAERTAIEEEERRKEEVRDMLTGMLVWETRDPDRDILVEECKEAILKLSKDKETFLGPYPGGKGEPSEESLAKLSKLEPLPPLLQNFELDAHVGLIQRLLEEDPELVHMQSALSGGGTRETAFWRNYFFHCAYTRYEAGLSIDEIWCEPPPAAAPELTDDEGEPQEEEIVFNEEEEKAFPGEPTTDVDAPFTKETPAATAAVAAAASTVEATSGVTRQARTNSSGAESTDFEMVAEQDGVPSPSGNDESIDEENYELDELEAEIARELEN